MTIIGAKIKEMRKLRDMSLQELGDKIGVQRATVQRYESGDITNIPYDKIEGLAKALHVTPVYLMGWESDAVTRERRAKEILSGLYNMLSEGGQKKLIEYLAFLQTNPENVDPDKFVKEVFINGLNDEAMKKRKAVAEELRLLDKQERIIKRKI